MLGSPDHGHQVNASSLIDLRDRSCTLNCLLMDTAYLPTVTGICILCYMFPAYLYSFIRTKSHTFWDLWGTKHA